MFQGNPDPREPVLFGMRPGEVSGPVEVAGGYAVLRLERRTPGRQVPFEEARPAVEKELAARKFNAALRELLGRLRARARVERMPLPEEATLASPSPAPSPGR
jgi:parvulin-like peptidyl-prolyl isomerase